MGLAILVANSALARPAVDPSPVVRAERAFAADGLSLGVKRSFLKYAANEAIVLQPDPVSVQTTFQALPDDQSDPPLVWWPLWAGIARSGDLGFTSGPFSVGGKPGGYYFTVWKKQADGAWKWVFDGGTPSDMTKASPQGTAPTYLARASGRRRPRSNAFAEVKAAEDALATAAVVDLRAAYLSVLAPKARVVGSRSAPTDTRAGQVAELNTRPTSMSFGTLAGQASAAGDLAWTYGDAHWSQDQQERRGHYVRIWQRQGRGWKLAFDELLPVRAKG